MKRIIIILVLCLSFCRAADIQVGHAVPCNIFRTGSNVELPVSIQRKSDSAVKVRFKTTNYWGEVIQEREEPWQQDFRLRFGALERGYYELHTTVLSADGSVVKTQMNSFAVADFSNRSAQEVRDGGYRFGMKLWLISEIWWNRQLTWDPDKIMDMCCKLGLQWTRAQLGQKEYMDTVKLIKNHPVNVVLKVEMYPESMIDKSRYPDITDFSKVKGHVKALLPKKNEYQAYLKNQVRQIPPEQQVFEVWNEPWQWNKTMSAEDFALLADWASEAIIELRPDAIIGSNIYGTVSDYDKRVIAAQKLRNQKMVAIHPYCTRTTEYRGFRQILWNYRDYIEETTGKKVDFYATEFGWSTAPAGDKVVTEAGQAKNTVREAFELYAADVKTLIPHTMATREQNPKEREDFFGFFRLNSEPKPALIAFSNAARMIDGGEFLGEEYFGPGIGAMRFKKDNAETLVLWTEDKDIPFTYESGLKEVTVTDIMGRTQTRKTDNGKLSLALSGNPIYLVGVKPAAKLITPNDEPALDRWRPRTVTHTLKRGGELRLDLSAKNCASSLQSYWSWTPNEIAIRFDVKDKTIVLTGPDGKGNGDRIVFDLCLRPGRQFDQVGIYDYRFTIIPGSSPKLLIDNPRFDREMDGQSVPGVKWNFETTPQGYRVELRMQTTALGMEQISSKNPISYRIVLYNRDRTDVDEWTKYHTRIFTQSDKLNFNELNLIGLAD